MKRFATSCWRPRADSRQNDKAARPTVTQQITNTSQAGAVLLLTLLEDGSYRWSTTGGNAEPARVICRVIAGDKHTHVKGGLVLSPPLSPGSPWLSLQPVAANAAALAAWSAACVPDVLRCLLRMADSEPGLLCMMAEVAASVAAPQEAAWIQAPRTRTYTPSKQLFSGMYEALNVALAAPATAAQQPWQQQQHQQHMPHAQCNPWQGPSQCLG